MSTLSAHKKSEKGKKPREEQGCELIYLPPYSPDCFLTSILMRPSRYGGVTSPQRAMSELLKVDPVVSPETDASRSLSSYKEEHL